MSSTLVHHVRDPVLPRRPQGRLLSFPLSTEPHQKICIYRYVDIYIYVDICIYIHVCIHLSTRFIYLHRHIYIYIQYRHITYIHNIYIYIYDTYVHTVIYTYVNILVLDLKPKDLPAAQQPIPWMVDILHDLICSRLPQLIWVLLYKITQDLHYQPYLGAMVITIYL